MGLLFLFPLYAFSGIPAPKALRTDLLEHGDRVWQQACLTNLSVEQVSPENPFYQTAIITTKYPCFSWQTSQIKRQVAYRIQVASSSKALLSDQADIWDSQWQTDGRSLAKPYRGKALQPGSLYFWRVMIRDGQGRESEWSRMEAFRTIQTFSEEALYEPSYYPLEKTMENPTQRTVLNDSTIVIDFGKASFGRLRLQGTATQEKDTVLIHFGEALKDGRVDRRPSGSIRYQCYRLPLLSGTHSYTIDFKADKRNTGRDAVKMPAYTGEVLPFRYVEIQHKGNGENFSVRRESVHYPFDDNASFFACSNDTLNQIWDLCKHSIKATSFTGLYVDGDRERIPYEADALINQLCHYAVDAEYSMARRTLDYLLDHPTWPTEWCLQTLMMAWYDYLYTGDTSFIASHYQRLQRSVLLPLLQENGLISTTASPQEAKFLHALNRREPFRDIVDWPNGGSGLNEPEGGEADGFVFSAYNAVVNAFHYEALKCMADIAEVLDMKDDVNYYRSQQKEFLKRYNQAFLRNGVYVDGLDVQHSSLHANMMPMAFGMVPEESKKTVADFIVSRGMACSVYGAQFLIEALYEADRPEAALALLTKTDKRSWYNMIQTGSTITTEAWDNTFKPNQDWNHAWGAAPANLISRKLMGVELQAPAQFSIRPQLGSLSWATLTCPTIWGSLSIDIRQEENACHLKCSIPSNTTAKLYVPSSKHLWMNAQRQKLQKDKSGSAWKILEAGEYEFYIK